MAAIDKFKISKDVINILLENEELTSYVGGRIFPLTSKGDIKGDFVVYQRDGYKSNLNKMSTSSTSVSMYIVAISKEYDRSVNMASIIYNALDGRFSYPNMEIHLEDSTEDYNNERYFQILLFSITF